MSPTPQGPQGGVDMAHNDWSFHLSHRAQEPKQYQETSAFKILEVPTIGQ